LCSLFLIKSTCESLIAKVVPKTEFSIFIRIWSKIVCSITKADAINRRAGVSSAIYIGKRGTWSSHWGFDYTRKPISYPVRRKCHAKHSYKSTDSMRLTLDRITSAVIIIHSIVHNWQNLHHGYSKCLKSNSIIYCYLISMI